MSKETIYIEIDGAAGGDEGNIFAAELARAYEMWARKNGLQVKEQSTLPSLLQVRGENAYTYFAHESGVHRVQRVPETEKRGRVHTSTVTVNVSGESSLQPIVIRPEDIEFSACRSSGKGGQHVNRTESKVRLVHKPSGIVVECQEERSQVQNREKAMQKLCDELQRRQLEQASIAASDSKRQQVGSGSRNEKIRTYNYHDSRVVDHRLGIKTSKLKDVMNGDLSPFYSA